MTHTDMTKPFSTNPKLADWVPSEQQIQTITAARELLDVMCRLQPEVMDTQQLENDTKEWLHNLIAYRKRYEASD